MLLCLAMVLSLAACGTGSTGSTGNASSTASAGNTADNNGKTGSVYWLNFKPESDEVLQDVAKMYKEKTGVDVKVVTAASGTYGQQQTAEMDKSNPPTIFVVTNQADVDKWSDYTLDLKDTPIAKEQSTSDYELYDGDKLAGIGYCYECYGIIVNPDLLQQAGHTVDEITNFETLKAVVEDVHSRASELGFDAFTSCDMDSSSSWRFTGHMVNTAYFYEQKDNPWTECPASITGAQLDKFKNLYDLAINNSISDPKELATGGHDPSEQFRSGKAAFQVQGSWEWEGMKEQVPNAVMIPYYCGYEGEEKAGLNSGTGNYWAVNAKASPEDQQATMDFLVWCVTDPEASRKLVDTFGAMPFKSAAESTNAFLADADEYIANGCYNMTWVTDYQPNVDEYRAAFVSALNQYNADQSDANWELVRTAVVDGWATQYKNVNG